MRFRRFIISGVLVVTAAIGLLSGCVEVPGHEINATTTPDPTPTPTPEPTPPPKALSMSGRYVVSGYTVTWPDSLSKGILFEEDGTITQVSDGEKIGSWSDLQVTLNTSYPRGQCSYNGEIKPTVRMFQTWKLTIFDKDQELVGNVTYGSPQANECYGTVPYKTVAVTLRRYRSIE